MKNLLRKTKLLLAFQKYGTVGAVLILTVLTLFLTIDTGWISIIIFELLFGFIIASILFCLSIATNSCLLVKLAIVYNWLIYNCIIMDSHNVFTKMDLNKDFIKGHLFGFGVVLLFCCVMKFYRQLHKRN